MPLNRNHKIRFLQKISNHIGVFVSIKIQPLFYSFIKHYLYITCDLFIVLSCIFEIIHFPFRCESFPTYPRSYDLVHAAGLLSLEIGQHRRCTMLDLFTEIDRLLRPEVPNHIVLFLCCIHSYHALIALIFK